MVVIGGLGCCVMVDRAMAVCGAAAAERRSRAAVCRLFIVVVIMLLNGCSLAASWSHFAHCRST